MTAPLCTDREDCHDHMRAAMRETVAPVIIALANIEGKLDHNGNRLTRVETVQTLVASLAGVLVVIVLGVSACAVNAGYMRAPQPQGATVTQR